MLCLKKTIGFRGEEPWWYSLVCPDLDFLEGLFVGNARAEVAIIAEAEEREVKHPCDETGRARVKKQKELRDRVNFGDDTPKGP